LPGIFGEVITASVFPRQAPVSDSSDPAIVVKCPVPEHLEVLRLSLLLSVLVIEAVDHANAFDWLLLHTVDFGGLWNVSGLENGRRDIDRMVELGANAAAVL